MGKSPRKEALIAQGSCNTSMGGMGFIYPEPLMTWRPRSQPLMKRSESLVTLFFSIPQENPIPMSASTLDEIFSFMPVARKARFWSLSWIHPTGPDTILERDALGIIMLNRRTPYPRVAGFIKPIRQTPQNFIPQIGLDLLPRQGTLTLTRGIYPHISIIWYFGGRDL